MVADFLTGAHATVHADPVTMASARSELCFMTIAQLGPLLQDLEPLLSSLDLHPIFSKFLLGVALTQDIE